MSFFIIIYDFMALKSHEYTFKHSLCSLTDQLSDLPPGTVLFPCVAVVYGGTVIKIEYINAVVSGTGTSVLAAVLVSSYYTQRLASCQLIADVVAFFLSQMLKAKKPATSTSAILILLYIWANTLTCLSYPLP